MFASQRIIGSSAVVRTAVTALTYGRNGIPFTKPTTTRTTTTTMTSKVSLSSSSSSSSSTTTTMSTKLAAVAGITTTFAVIEKLQSRTVATAANSLVTKTSNNFSALVAGGRSLNSVQPAVFTPKNSSLYGSNIATRSFATSSESKGLMAWYESKLNANPVGTKMVTGGFLWGLGDAVAQVVPKLFAQEDGAKTTSVVANYDYIRTARASFFGCFIHAPLSHLHFNFLEWMTVRGGFTGYSIPLFKAFMEQFVYWSWISNSIYHGAMEVLSTMKFDYDAIYNRIATTLWDTQKAQWVFWIPIQLLNFQYIPVRHQLNVVLLTSVVWTALLSAWYPPAPPVTEGEKEGEEIETKET